jgi:Domain of unknown function (DUF4406)
MRGILAYNHPAFDAAAAKLRDEGHTVFSPAEKDRDLWPSKDWYGMTGDLEMDGFPDNSAMREVIEKDLVWITRYAEAIALLPGWKSSKGVAVEVALAAFLGLYIREL